MWLTYTVFIIFIPRQLIIFDAIVNHFVFKIHFQIAGYYYVELEVLFKLILFKHDVKLININQLKRLLCDFNIILKNVSSLCSFNLITTFKNFLFQKYCKVHIR